MVSKIEARAANPIWDLPEVNTDTPIQKKTTTLPFSYDSFLPEALSTGNPEARAHHKLETPQFDPFQFESVKKEMDAIISKASEENKSTSINDTSHLNETVLLLLYFACMKAQQESREEGNLFAMDNARQRQDANRKVQENYFNTLDEKVSRAKTDSVLGWVSWGLWGAIATAGVASIALTIATGGAALPTVLVVANSALAIGQGGVQTTQGVLQYQNNNATGELTFLQAKRDVNAEKIREEVELMKQSVQMIADSWEAMVEVLNNQYSAATNQ